MRTHRVERELTDSGATVDAFSHLGATTTRLKVCTISPIYRRVRKLSTISFSLLRFLCVRSLLTCCITVWHCWASLEMREWRQGRLGVRVQELQVVFA